MPSKDEGLLTDEETLKALNAYPTYKNEPIRYPLARNVEDVVRLLTAQGAKSRADERAKTIREVVTRLDSFLLTERETIGIIQRVGATCKFPDQCKALALCQVEAIKRGLVADHPEIVKELK